MSYNIAQWTTLALENLVIPMWSEDTDLRWGPDNTVSIHPCEDGSIDGVVINGKIHVETIKLRAAASGWAYEHLKDHLADSMGYLDVITVWEGGDSILRLTVTDGQIMEQVIDIVHLIRENENLTIVIRERDETIRRLQS